MTALRKHPLADKTEHTDRGALETLLQAVANAHSAATKVQHEPKRAQDKGAPDFKITRTGVMVGYVEAKQIGANLEAVLKTDQIKRYLELNPNLLVTDYLRFIWIKDGKIKEAQGARLCEASAIESKLPLNPERIAEVEQLLRGFFLTAPKGVKRASELADALAVRSKLLRDFLKEELERQDKEKEGGKLLGLYEAFKKQVSHELKLEEFADAFAQTLAYGLFLAKLNVKPGVTITLANADEHVPGGFSLIRELVGFLKVLNQDEYRDIKWVVEEILSIVNHLNVDAIRDDLSFKKRKAYSPQVKAKSEEEWRLFSKDPFVYFYEDYLAKYDKAMKKARGVYYTPPPIVNFIVRAINDILKDTFGIEQGLADRERVTVLDFACGTGTFLVEVLERIFDEIGGAEAGTADMYVREHILKNIYGFEYLIAPYTIAHLKLSQYLAELAARANNPDIALKEGERFQVFLTNTLEPIEPQKNFLLPELTHETEAAQKVKDKQILVITGNPPYFGLSKNRGPHATGSIEKYKYVDGAHFGEKKHWLTNDYVKFLAFAQAKMDEVDEGMVAAITDNSYLDNPTFRGMRQSLLTTFNQVWVIDLHGNLEKREKPPQGQANENVFDIKQGVSICLLIKRPGLARGVWHLDRWGRRQEKYEWAASHEIKELAWKRLQPNSPYYFFRPFDEKGRPDYESFVAVDELFGIGGIGFITSRDGLLIAKSEADLRVQVERFLDLSVTDEAIKSELEIGDNENWSVADVRPKMFGERFNSDLVTDVYYGPFDTQKLYLDRRLVFRPRMQVTAPMMKSNIGLIVNKIARDDPTALVARSPVAHKSASRYDPSYVFSVV